MHYQEMQFSTKAYVVKSENSCHLLSTYHVPLNSEVTIYEGHL